MKNMTEFERREADCECPIYKYNEVNLYAGFKFYKQYERRE